MNKTATTIIFLLLLIPVFGQSGKIIHTNVPKIYTQIDNEGKQNWTLSPETNPDNLDVECKPNQIRTVRFVTPTDSAVFRIKIGKTINFTIVLNQKDTARTRVTGIPANVNFSKKYIAANKNVTRVEIPEVHELVNIVIAIRDGATKDSNMVNLTTPYYREVVRYFAPYKNHPVVRLVSDQIKERDGKVFNIESYVNYYSYKMNACGYTFDKNNRIVNTGFIRKMGFNDSEDLMVKTAGMFADFAKKSKFRAFYKNHKAYYDSLIATYNQLTPIAKMQNWLVSKFKFDYGSYVVYFSPLIGGAHSTNHFSDNGFSQTFMFVCGANRYKGYSEKGNELLASRVVFTEIDHNFVNPVSDKYQDRIHKIFSTREKWVDASNQGTSGYPTPYSVFNEYMTFAVFGLYAMDISTEKEFADFASYDLYQMMEKKGRGFIKFGEFQKKLIEYYKANPKASVNAWYDYMLDWCEKQ